MPNRGLGRREDRDERDRQFLARAALPPTAAIPIDRKYWWDNGAWLDQGETGTCVGHGWAHWAEDSPITHPGEIIDPFAIYRGACLLDPWPENDNGDVDQGTSVRAGAKFLRNEGRIAEFRWAWDLQTIVDWLLVHGPVVVGTSWYNSMFDPKLKHDETGTLRYFVELDPSSGFAGGHCYVLNGVNVPARCVRMKNSWGRNWGAGGRASLSFDTLDALISENGEMCVALEVTS